MTDTLTRGRAERAPSQREPGRGHQLRLALSRFRGGPQLAFWTVIIAILVLPILLFLLVAFSPRLFDQGPQWFTLSGFHDAFSGPLLRGIENSLIVGAATAVASTSIASRWPGSSCAPAFPAGGCGAARCSRSCSLRRTWSHSGGNG